ncbi:hypothetical protein VTI28DRAFT_6853 [Corynascus sepedonium]
MPSTNIRIRFSDQVPNDEGYRRYLKGKVLAFIEEDPHNKGLANCAAVIVFNSGHSSESDRRNHSTVKFYDLDRDGGARFYVTQHVPVKKYRVWLRERRQRRH